MMKFVIYIASYSLHASSSISTLNYTHKRMKIILGICIVGSLIVTLTDGYKGCLKPSPAYVSDDLVSLVRIGIF